MKNYIDNRLLRQILSNGQEEFLKSLNSPEPIVIDFGWVSLFEYLDLGDIFKELPKFDEKDPFFSLSISTLNQGLDKEILIRLYDELFIQNLTVVKAMPQIQQIFLLEKIREKRIAHPQPLFDKALDYYEKYLTKDPYNAIHGLILYFAWDRLCVQLAIIFEHVYADAKALQGLPVLKECLLESFQHITSKGEASPSFFRLIEALFAYQLREENLDTHSEIAWATLCKSSTVLRSRDELPDVFYVDYALADSKKESQEKIRVFTGEPQEQITIAQALARHMIETLKKEIPDWRYDLSDAEVISFRF